MIIEIILTVAILPFTLILGALGFFASLFGGNNDDSREDTDSNSG